MLSVSSFKHALTRFDFSEHEVWVDDGQGHAASRLGKGTLAHVARWVKHNRAEEVWATIRKVDPTLEVAAFIRVVLEARQYASWGPGISDREYLRHCREEVWKRVRACRSPLELVAALKQAGIIGTEEAPKFIRKRQWADVEFFVRTVGDALHARCGRRFDAEVAILAEIAFPRKMVHADQIKAWRARRPGAEPSPIALGIIRGL